MCLRGKSGGYVKMTVSTLILRVALRCKNASTPKQKGPPFKEPLPEYEKLGGTVINCGCFADRPFENCVENRHHTCNGGNY